LERTDVDIGNDRPGVHDSAVLSPAVFEARQALLGCGLGGTSIHLKRRGRRIWRGIVNDGCAYINIWEYRRKLRRYGIFRESGR